MSQGFDPREPKRKKGLTWGAIAIVGAAFVGFNVLPPGADRAVAPISTGVDAAERPFEWTRLIRVEHEAFLPAVVVADAGESIVRGALKSGDTLTDLFERLGASRADAYAAIEAARSVLDPRKLRAGIEATVFFEAGEDAARLTGFSLKPAADRSVLIARDDEGVFQARELVATLETELVRVEGVIESSLYSAARAAGAGDQQVVDFAQVFAYDVDFQRGIREGDRFEILYERKVDERGHEIATGALVYAALDAAALSKAFYRFTPSDDDVTDYFTAEGESATKFLMKTPINGARLSSNFGMRRHPILGFNRLHAGTDFAARTGTPIMAAGNGTVVKSEWFGGYGRYVRIRHANGYETAYAHMSRYGEGIKRGARVRQGQTIGYVGTSGRSTGPHLHYEVLINGKHVDPMGLKLPTGRKLEGQMLADFIAVRDQIDAARKAAPAAQPGLVADVDAADDDAG